MRLCGRMNPLCLCFKIKPVNLLGPFRYFLQRQESVGCSKHLISRDTSTNVFAHTRTTSTFSQKLMNQKSIQQPLPHTQLHYTIYKLLQSFMCPVTMATGVLYVPGLSILISFFSCFLPTKPLSLNT